MNNNKINFAIIGTNKITHQLLETASNYKQFNLSAVYSRQQSTADSFAEQYQAKYRFTSINELAKCAAVDAVYIASPNSCHAEQAMQLMAQGKHVLCEKPIAANTQEIDQMIACAKKHKVCFMEAMLITHLPNFTAIKNALPKLGKIRKFSATQCQYSSRYNLYKQGKNPNTFNPEFANGALMDIGIYPLYAAVHLFGEPDTIQSDCHKLNSGVDACGDLILKYKSQELQATIAYSKINFASNGGEIQGENGYLVYQHAIHFNKAHIYYNDGQVEDISQKQHNNPMYYELGHFLEMIARAQYESNINTWQQSQQVLKIIDNVRRQQGINYPSDVS